MYLCILEHFIINKILFYNLNLYININNGNFDNQLLERLDS